MSAYGNGKRINIQELSSINKDCSSNNTKISIPTHFGTHLDFPYHFSMDGKTGDQYKAKDFIFKNIAIVEVDCLNKTDKIIHLSDIKNREEFRQLSVISPICIDQVMGLGKDSYIKGLELLLKYLVAL